MSRGDHEKIKAAGGVVSRLGDDDEVELLLVHRPRYDDWTFPKGKAEPGERWREAAYREVLEETGYRCALGRKLGGVEYDDHKGRTKEVRFWTMTVIDGEFVPNDEVDRIRWCSVDEARRALTYERDRDLVDLLVEASI